jgi:hypothetical protein
LKTLFKQTERAPGGATTLDDDHSKIRCPKCRWQPRRSDRWMCACGHVWNTFDTQGLCPACDAKWRETQCLRCHQWSQHEDWYVPGASRQ